MPKRTLHRFLLAFMALLWACGDARVSSTFVPDEEDARVGRDAREDEGPDDDVEPSDDAYVPPDGELTCVLIPSVGGDIFVGVDSSVQIGVYQYDLATGEPMVDERIEFSILDGSVDVELAARNVRSDEDGLAAVRLSAGGFSGSATVRAYSPCANSLDLEVEVLALPTGNLRVTFNYPFADVYMVAPLDVQVHLADTIRCRDISTGEYPASPLRDAQASNIADESLFESLTVEQTYTVFVSARGSRGERAAQGCLDAVVIREDRTTEVTVDLFLIPLNPAGDYDVLSHWDFRDAIAESGEVGALIVEVLDIFEDPGRGIYDFLLGLIEDYVGGIISVALDLFLSVTGIDDLLSDGINSLIESSPFLSDVVQIGRDLRSIIAELEVMSELNIGKLGSDYELYGVDRWTGVALYWRLGCEPTDPPDCGRIPVDLDIADLGLMRGEWTGRVLGYDRLDIDRHPVDFEYGRLIIYVLEYLVLPAITGDPGPVTLSDLMSSILNCEGIGDFVAGGDGGCLCAFGACICDDDVEGFCESFIDLAFGSLLRGFIESLSFDAVLDIRGQCTLENVNEDLLVDALTSGEYIGSIRIGSAPTPFVADFCGVNQVGTLDLITTCLGDE